MDTDNNSHVEARGSAIKKAVVRGIGGAAVATAIIYVFLFDLKAHAPETPTLTGSFSTIKGEHRCEALPEASQVCLNTGSMVRYVFNGRTRNVELISGEASFDVHPDSRPFDVLAGSGLLIHDLSTSFDVYKKEGGAVVTVIQGRVKIIAPADNGVLHEFKRAQPELAWKSAPEFHRLQQAQFDEATGKLRERHILTEQGLAQLLAWQRGRIDLTGKPLTEALAEFARYQPITTRFNFQDRGLWRLRVGGELEATHLSDFLDSLTAVYGIQHTSTRDRDGQTVVSLSLPQSAGNHSQQK